MRIQPLALLAFLLSIFPSVCHAIHLQEIVQLPSPVGVVSDGSDRLFILQQEGKIRVWNGEKLLDRSFLNLTADISCCGERGLLGLVFHPNYANNGFFYVDYTRASGDIVIARFKVSKNPNVANRKSRRILLVIPHHLHGNHNGGQLQFGPDGYLYIGVGDGGSGGDPPNNAQNLGVLLGKVLRIDVDSGKKYGIPPTNPFVSNPNARPEIWAYGLRNPWRFSFDRQRGDLFIGDVGQDSREEIDLQRKTSKPGINYGWRRMEGTACYNPTSNCRIPGLKLPILQYSHDGRTCAVIGGYRYRGDAIPSLTGTYLYADFCSGTIWGAKRTSTGWKSNVLLETAPRNISSFGQDPAGELYVSDLNGAVLKIVE